MREKIKAGLQICNEVLNRGKCVNQEYQLFEQLALSYLSSDDHHDYSKAVGIYEYMKYLDRSKEQELDKRVLRAQEKFLQKIKGCPEKIKSTKPYADSLRSFRYEISEELTRVNYMVMKKILLRIREFIINKIIIPMIDDCIEELGGLPKVNDRDARHSIFCTGSIALGTMTPWSDLEFGILLEDRLSKEDYTRVKAYFINLTHLLNIKVLTFGETVLHYQGIQELNDFSTGNSKDNWFVDNFTTKGFCFDAALPDGSKTPFGRKDCKGVRDYELIGTVEELTRFQKEEEGWNKSDPSLVQALNHVRFIHGDEELFNRGYLEALKEFSEINRERAFRILKEDAEKLNPVNELINVDRAGTILNVKKEIYRFPDRMIVALGDCLEGEGETTWDIIDNLVTKGKLKSTAAENLKYALNIATELRLRTYSNNKGRKEDISALVKYDIGIKELQDAALVESVFYLKDLSELHEYYYVVLALGSVLGDAGSITELEEVMSKCISFYSDTPIMKGHVYKRFLQYYKAIDEFKKDEGNSVEINDKLATLYFIIGRYDKALEGFQKNLETLIELGNDATVASCLNNIGASYERLGKYEDAIKNKEESLEMRRRIYKGDHADIAASLNNMGLSCESLGRYDKALKYYEESLEMSRRIYKGDHASVAGYLHSVGNGCVRLGRYGEALKYYEESLKMRGRIYKGDHIDVASSLNNIGEIYRCLGKYQEALKCHEESLKMRRRIYKGDHAFIAISLNSMGLICENLGRYEEALKYHEESLEMRKRIFKEDHADIASSLNNIGITYRSLGRYEEALQYEEQSLEVQRRIYKGDHADIAGSLNNAGLSCERLGKYDKALKYKEESLEMMKRIYKGDHADIASSLNNIGETYRRLGKYEEALKFHEESLEMKRRIYKGDHASVAGSLNNIGEVYRSLGRYDEALKCHEESLKMRGRIYKGDHIDVASSLNNIGETYRNLRRYDEALKYHEESLKMGRRIYKTDHAFVALSLNNVGNICESLGKYDNALKYHEESLEMGKRVYKGDHVNLAASLNDTGKTYRSLGRYGEALKYHEESLEIGRRIYKGDHANLAAFLNNMGETYRSLRRYDEALKYHEESLEMGRRVYKGDHANLALSLNNIGGTYKSLKKYEEALESYEESLGMRRRIYKGDHIDIASSLQNLACIYHVKALLEKDKKEDQNFEEYLNKAKITFEEAINSPNSSAEVCAAYAMYSLKYHEPGKLEEYQKIVRLLEQAINKQDESGLGYGQSDKATTLWALKEFLDRNEEVSIKASVLANYLLCKVHHMYGKVEEAQESLDDLKTLAAISMSQGDGCDCAINQYLLDDAEMTTEINPDLNRLVNTIPANTPPDTGTTSTSIGNVMQVDTSISMSATNVTTPNRTQDQSSSLGR
ncbi:MAG: hypothetical protein K0R73_682 [Candidatus Midichloriaceae bacterium]|jgi:tetratricopeptide (TPR) repeat protein|nr:hypothetical protein [Candidatus Midichloriaceae bacterium]